MHYCSIEHVATLCLLAAAVAAPPAVQADLTVHSGWDLLVTVPGSTEFMGQHWQGVPIGTYDFGSQGIQNVGPADTIIQRPQNATVADYGQSATVAMSIAALQMRSVDPFDPDGAGPAPLSYYYITLDPSVPSGGSVTIDFDHEPGLAPHGWFSTAFSVNYALRLGDVGGMVLATGTEGFELGLGFWNHEKTGVGGVPLISGVNYLLNGVDILQDFHLAFGPNGEGVPTPGEQGPGGAPPGCYPPGDPIFTSPRYIHLVTQGYDPAKHGITECPEPSALALFALTLPFALKALPLRKRAL
jgi:hypothetical protein